MPIQFLYFFLPFHVSYSRWLLFNVSLGMLHVFQKREVEAMSGKLEGKKKKVKADNTQMFSRRDVHRLAFQRNS